MKWNWDPVTLSELVRQAVLAAVLFKLVNWDDTQVAGFLMLVSALLAWLTSSLTIPTKTAEAAGTSKTQVQQAAAANAAAGTPGGTGLPGVPGGSAGPDAPGGLGNMSPKDNRSLRVITGGFTGHVAMMLIVALVLSGCGRPITPAEGARDTKDVLSLANDMHKAVFDAYVAGAIPGPQADPFMSAVETKLIPAARKTIVALKAWQAATTIDLKKVKAGDLADALNTLSGITTDLVGTALPPGVASDVNSIAGSITRIIASIRAAIAEGRAVGPDQVIILTAAPA